MYLVGKAIRDGCCSNGTDDGTALLLAGGHLWGSGNRARCTPWAATRSSWCLELIVRY